MTVTVKMHQAINFMCDLTIYVIYHTYIKKLYFRSVLFLRYCKVYYIAIIIEIPIHIYHNQNHAYSYYE